MEIEAELEREGRQCWNCRADRSAALQRMWRNHVNAKAAKTAKKNLSKRCFARFAIFAFNVILSQALQGCPPGRPPKKQRVFRPVSARTSRDSIAWDA